MVCETSIVSMDRCKIYIISVSLCPSSLFIGPIIEIKTFLKEMTQHIIRVW